MAVGVCLLVSGASAQDLDGRKQARAVRIPDGAISVDGRLDDAGWRDVLPITDFVQAEPIEGAEPTDSMEIRFAYDDTALYIGARMSSTSGAPIQAHLSRRDEAAQAENLQIELDTYLDRRTAYMFGLTASGVRLDHYHSSDDENNWDSGYDPVWEGRTTVDDQGWTAEFWLPFSQLRFNDSNALVWGLNIRRFVPSLNEEVYWVPVLRTEEGWASRFGDLRGMTGVRPRTRLEILPYVAGSTRTIGNRDLEDPFQDSLNLDQRVGADLKVGLGPNLTLEATVNPDFGQIEADPAEVNLSAFETFFGERRPFFIEGSDLLRGETNNFFYSRRIGGPPVGPADGDYVDYPATTTILGAAKLTGRLPSGTSIGALGAVTGEEFARTSNGGLFDETRVAPRAYWGVARVQQEIGVQGSTAGAQMTAMHRDLGGGGDPLADRLTRTAITAAADTRVRFLNRTYEASFSAGGTYVEGDPAAIERIQRANTHLFHRPDQDEVRLDPARTSLGGLQIRTSFDKIAGRHWLGGGNIMIESPEFEPNDFGRLNYAGDVQANARIQYRETVPGRYLRSYSVQLNSGSTSYYQRSLGARVNTNLSTNLTFHNFWSFNINYNRNYRGQDVQLTRGGPSMGTPHGWNMNASLRNGNAPSTQWNAGMFYRENELGDFEWSPDANLSMRPSPSWRISVGPEYSRERSSRQYVTARSGGRPETFGRRYIFGTIDRHTWATEVRVNYVFKPDLTLEVYAEPFAASGRYSGFGELEATRSHRLRTYGADGIGLERREDGSFVVTDGADVFTIGDRDFKVLSFRSNVVLRWEWRPGSTLFVVWQQNRRDERTTSDEGVISAVGPGDMFRAFNAAGDNILAVKTTFWISR